jgi:hypothetical protein
VRPAPWPYLPLAVGTFGVCTLVTGLLLSLLRLLDGLS